ncbi:sensor histidine kinase [Pseudarthrobacter sp. NPDC058329]|uniref:sensor histidine kinase n=1 Tax=Pseudarthrobacter sp. NPDC058329 TaxID=3346448 RepID=UPI0036D9631F
MLDIFRWADFPKTAKEKTARSPDLWQRFLDIVVVAVVAAHGAEYIRSGFSDVPALALLLATLVPAALRRHLPEVALMLAAVLAVVLSLNEGLALPALCVLQVCLMSFAILRPRAQAVVATVCVGLVLVTESLALSHLSLLDPMTLALVAWTTAAGGMGSAVHAQRQYVQALEEQSKGLLKTREAIVARRVAEERMRIARELHDVMAHHIAAINVHAGSAEANISHDEGSAIESLGHIRTASTEVLRELQAILHVLRSGDSEPKLQSDENIPIPGAADIPRLLDTFRSLGLRVEHQEGLLSRLPSSLPVAVNLALYRIIQEALTNAHKHGTGTARLDLETTDTDIILKIHNDRREESAEASGDKWGDEARTGFGLVGMHERAASANGRLRVTPASTTFTVETTLPLKANS